MDLDTNSKVETFVQMLLACNIVGKSRECNIANQDNKTLQEMHRLVLSILSYFMLNVFNYTKVVTTNAADPKLVIDIIGIYQDKLLMEYKTKLIDLTSIPEIRGIAIPVFWQVIASIRESHKTIYDRLFEIFPFYNGIEIVNKINKDFVPGKHYYTRTSYHEKTIMDPLRWSLNEIFTSEIGPVVLTFEVESNPKPRLKIEDKTISCILGVNYCTFEILYAIYSNNKYMCSIHELPSNPDPNYLINVMEISLLDLKDNANNSMINSPLIPHELYREIGFFLSEFTNSEEKSILNEHHDLFFGISLTTFFYSAIERFPIFDNPLGQSVNQSSNSELNSLLNENSDMEVDSVIHDPQIVVTQTAMNQNATSTNYNVIEPISSHNEANTSNAPNDLQMVDAQTDTNQNATPTSSNVVQTISSSKESTTSTTENIDERPLKRQKLTSLDETIPVNKLQQTSKKRSSITPDDFVEYDDIAIAKQKKIQIAVLHKKRTETMKIMQTKWDYNWNTDRWSEENSR